MSSSAIPYPRMARIKDAAAQFGCSVHYLRNLCRSGKVRSVRRTERYLEPLIRAGFIIRFPSGVVCIVDWWIHNAQPKWEYAVTVHMDELLQLEVSETGRYFIPNRQTQPEQAAGR